MLWFPADDLPSLARIARLAANHTAVRHAEHKDAVLDTRSLHDRPNNAKNRSDGRRFVRADGVNRTRAIGEGVNAQVRIKGGFCVLAEVEHEADVARPEVSDLGHGAKDEGINCTHTKITVRPRVTSRKVAQARACDASCAA
jgi:hypothetical protein